MHMYWEGWSKGGRWLHRWYAGSRYRSDVEVVRTHTVRRFSFSCFPWFSSSSWDFFCEKADVDAHLATKLPIGKHGDDRYSIELLRAGTAAVIRTAAWMVGILQGSSRGMNTIRESCQQGIFDVSRIESDRVGSGPGLFEFPRVESRVRSGGR